MTAGLLPGNNGTTGDFQQDTSMPLNSIPDGTLLDATFRDITANISGTGTILRVRVVADSRVPELAFDNIRVIGDLANTAKPTLIRSVDSKPRPLITLKAAAPCR